MTTREGDVHGVVRNAMAYVLAGGRGTKLMELTDKRAKPAVFFGGKSRIIDFALSNAINSGIRRIASISSVSRPTPGATPRTRRPRCGPGSRSPTSSPASHPAPAATPPR